MNVNWLLLWMGTASSFVFLLRMARQGTLFTLRVFSPGLVLAVAGVSVWSMPEIAGYLTGACWFVLLIIPALGYQIVNAALSRKRFRLARNVSRVLAILHPFDGASKQPQMIRAIELIEQHRFAEADELLNDLKSFESAVGRAAIVMEARQTGRWQDLLDRLEQHPHRDRLFRDPSLADAYIQAFGELRRIPEMVAAARKLLGGSSGALSPSLRNLIRLKVAAFAGRPSLVRTLLAGPLSDLPPDVGRYWLAMALSAAGDMATAQETFEALAANGSPRAARAARMRLGQETEPAREPLRNASEEWLESLEQQVLHESHFAVMSSGVRRKVRWTWIVAGSLVAVFLLEVPGGSTDVDNLIRLGALVIPTSLTPGEPWRFVSAAFLHFGVLHLGMNVLGILYFGRRLEQVWGGGRMAICYLTAAIGSIGLVPMFSGNVTPLEPAILVGASGGVMGLVGALIGHLTVGVLTARSDLVTRDFGLLVLIIALQMSFDATTPMVSSTCHLLGLAIGALFGMTRGWQLIREHRAAALSLSRPTATSISEGP